MAKRSTWTWCGFAYGAIAAAVVLYTLDYMEDKKKEDDG